MENEIRTGRFLGYCFTISCLPVVVGVFWYILNTELGIGTIVSLLLCVSFFVLGLFTGLSLLFRPKLLIRVTEEFMELYPGSVWGNECQIKVRLSDIEDFSVKSVSAGDGMSWFLTLYLVKPQQLSEKAKKWIRASTRYSEFEDSPDNLLHWGLSWPQGGVKRTEEKLRKLTSRCRQLR